MVLWLNNDYQNGQNIMCEECNTHTLTVDELPKYTINDGAIYNMYTKPNPMTIDDFRQAISSVCDWNLVCGNDFTKPTDALISTYQGLSEEEAQEFVDAILSLDYGEMVDAICDMMFVVGFGAVLQGLVIDTIEPVIGTYLDLIKAIKAKDLKTALQVLAYIVTSGEPLVETRKVDYVGAFARVLESNFSKFIPVDSISDDELKAECAKIESKGDYSGIKYEMRGDDVNQVYVLLASTDERCDPPRHFKSPKIVKGSSFVSVEELGGLDEFVL